MRNFLLGLIIGTAASALILAGGFYLNSFLSKTLGGDKLSLVATKILETGSGSDANSSKSPGELRDGALEKSKTIKGIYMTADVASDLGAGATHLRNSLIQIATSTEINGIVIDVKEVCGPDYNETNIKKLIQDLHNKDIWAIGRIVVFKDASKIYSHPEWYLQRKNNIAVGDECARKWHLRDKPPEETKTGVVFWRDKRGGYWLDPAHPETQEYILDFSKKMIDLGFDELQFDYIRFPSDGDVENAIYPAWDSEKTPKYGVLKNFFEFLNKNIKEYKPDIILSADLFGYAAIRAGDVGIGQRLEDIGDNFDYISFMVYPSHYYSGLYLAAEPEQKLPVVNFNRFEARKNPDTVVFRSLLFARNFLEGKPGTSTSIALNLPTATSSATTTPETVTNTKPRSKARLRPWLEDFFHEEDRAAKRPYGIEKVRKQIDAAEKVESHGWILWNAANIYSVGALRKEPQD